MTDMNDALIRSLTPERLVQRFHRAVRIMRVAIIATLGCVAAGIWVDPRWGITAIVPFVVTAMYGVVVYQYRLEIDRRIEEKQKAP